MQAGSGPEVGADGGLATLDEYLAGQDAAAMAGRTPVLAVGSNRSPAQLARKLREPSRPALGLVPIIRARVNGIGVGFSAHVGRWGYVPAAPVQRPGWQDQWLTWLDPVQLELVNATEINYRLVFAPYELQLAGCPSAAVPGWVFYRSRWGALATAPGATARPRRLTRRASTGACSAGPGSAPRPPTGPTSRRRSRCCATGMSCAGRPGTSSRPAAWPSTTVSVPTPRPSRAEPPRPRGPGGPGAG